MHRNNSTNKLVNNQFIIKHRNGSLETTKHQVGYGGEQQSRETRAAERQVAYQSQASVTRSPSGSLQKYKAPLYQSSQISSNTPLKQQQQHLVSSTTTLKQQFQH